MLHRPSDDEKRLLWAAREALVDEPRALPKVLLAVDWSVKSQVREAYRLLGKVAPLPPLQALQLLSKRFPDAKVRAFAVRCLEPLGDADLAAVTLQLVQVVKADRSHDTALNRFLLRRALRSPLVCGHALYWALAAEIDRETHCVPSCVEILQSSRRPPRHRRELRRVPRDGREHPTRAPHGLAGEAAAATARSSGTRCSW